MKLLVKGRRAGREIVTVTPASAGWRHVGFAAWRLSKGETLDIDTGEREACLVVLTGTASVRAGGEAWSGLGGRKSVFEERSPDAVYAPPHTALSVAADDDAEIALGSAPASGRYPARRIDGQAMKRFVRGQGANARHICDILPETAPAESLLVVEVVTPGGHSSSYPPHKHDTDDAPAETALEETYYHRVHPPQGFAFQRVYTDARDLDEAMAVEDHDVVMVPRGYHPVVMPYGYDGYYLNVMAGERRAWHFKNDPAHEWMLKR
jgi:5-deoxy-glucuronate isomerase